MISQEVVVSNKDGLHSRPATFLILEANKYKSKIWLAREDRRINAKSLLGVLSLGITQGTTVTIIADGSDESKAVEALGKLVESGFEEE